MDYVEISNSMIVYLLCGITVAIAFVQAVLYIRMAKKMTVKANIPATVPKTAFRVGLISAIGPALENLRTKMSGGDSKWLVVMSGACSLGIFGYLDVNEIGKGWGNAAAVAGGIIGMAILEKFVAKKVPKIREYNLGIAMIIGMLFAIIYDMAVGA